MTPDRRHWRPPRFSTEHTRRLGCSVESGASATLVRTPDRHHWRPVRLSTEHPRRLEGSVESGACAQNSNLVGVLFGAGVRVGSSCGKLDDVVRGPGPVVGVRVWVVYGPGRCRFTKIQPFEKKHLVPVFCTCTTPPSTLGLLKTGFQNAPKMLSAVGRGEIHDRQNGLAPARHAQNRVPKMGREITRKLRM